MSKVLCIGDVHEPVSREGYLDFCLDTYYAWDCDSVVFLGDLVDWHGISFHTKHPEAPGIVEEYELALKGVQKWYEAFPEAIVCRGNHDERIIRLAESVDIPEEFLKDHATIWETPNWEWVFDTVIDDVYYFHGTGCAGLHPAFNIMRQMSIAKWCVASIFLRQERRWAFLSQPVIPPDLVLAHLA